MTAHDSLYLCLRHSRKPCAPSKLIRLARIAAKEEEKQNQSKNKGENIKDKATKEARPKANKVFTRSLSNRVCTNLLPSELVCPRAYAHEGCKQRKDEIAM